MQVRRDVFFVLTVLLSFSALFVLVGGIMLSLASLEEIHSAKDWGRVSFRLWPVGLLDALLVVAALFCHRRYERHLNG